MEIEKLELGAHYLGNQTCAFKVWAPKAEQVHLKLLGERGREVLLQADEWGYHFGTVENVAPGTRYVFKLDDEQERPDPASRYQPEGVHGPSEVVDPQFEWNDKGFDKIAEIDYIIYELHTGTFTREGTFDAIIPHLEELKQLGVTIIELMPVAQFPGGRNWGYDGVFPFAAQNTYGGPQALKRLVDACHQHGLCILLDVVYNHLGPEGNYLKDFGHYFTDVYKTPWGEAINFDGPYSDEVRRYFFENVLTWLFEYHFDGVRLDAVHAIYDFSITPFLEELTELTSHWSINKKCAKLMTAESDLNNACLILPCDQGGWGYDSQWTDDFHHSLHTLLTGEREGYYLAFGEVGHLAKAYREGYVYTGQYSPYRKRRHGSSTEEVFAEQFIVYAQNHDQVGNRMFGDRLSALVSFEGLKLAAGVYILSPFTPMLFMGEEYGETNPFPFFVSHTDQHLIEGVRDGRKREFAAFSWQGVPPDPFAKVTFESAKLDHNKKQQERHQLLYKFYQALIALRKTLPEVVVIKESFHAVDYSEKERWLLSHRGKQPNGIFIAFSFANQEGPMQIPIPEGRWLKRFDSTDAQWGGEGGGVSEQLDAAQDITLSLKPLSFVVYARSDSL